MTTLPSHAFDRPDRGTRALYAGLIKHRQWCQARFNDTLCSFLRLAGVKNLFKLMKRFVVGPDECPCASMYIALGLRGSIGAHAEIRSASSELFSRLPIRAAAASR